MRDPELTGETYETESLYGEHNTFSELLHRIVEQSQLLVPKGVGEIIDNELLHLLVAVAHETCVSATHFCYHVCCMLLPARFSSQSGGK